MIDNRPLMGYILHCGIKKIDLNNRNLMIIRKALCISLTLLLSLGLFTTGAVAQSGCKDQACKQMLMGSSHHPGKSMSKSLLSDCCAGPHTVPCEFEPSRKTSALAEMIIGETLRDPGAVEVGYNSDRRWAIGLKEQTQEDPGSKGLNKDTVFLVTGAAGSIVSAITEDLAAASGGTFYLLDLTPEPDPQDHDLKRFSTDKEGLKRDIFERLKKSHKRVTPVMVDKEMAALERSRAALDAMEAVKKAGGEVHYASLDLMNHEAVSNVIKEIAEKYGRIDVLMHAAGLEISHAIPDKKRAEFDLVFDVKSDGWFNLISNIGDMPLGAAVVFSSVAGRFGNTGQTDYSAANDLLCKCISNFRSSRPETRGIAIDWTAWSGIGMAARGSIPTIMKQAGIDMLPPEAGIPIVRRELTAGTRGELVVGQNLGILVKEFDSEGGLDTGSGGELEKALRSRGVMIGKICAMGLYSGLTIETTLDPAKQPFLFDHQIGSTPVLPGVMGVEAMAEAARILFPDRYIGAVEEMNFLTPFKFYRNQPRAITVHAFFEADKDDIIADCTLLGSRTLHGQSKPEVTKHFEGRVRLASKPAKAVKGTGAPHPDKGEKIAASHVYRLYFHGPAYQVIDSAWRKGDNIIGAFAKDLPTNHEPSELPLAVAPRFIELCFQTASLSGLALQSRLGLPYSFRDLKIIASPEEAPNGTFYSVVAPNPDGTYDAKVVDEKGKLYMLLEGYQTMDLPDPVPADLLEPLQKAFRV